LPHAVTFLYGEPTIYIIIYELMNITYLPKKYIQQNPPAGKSITGWTFTHKKKVFLLEFPTQPARRKKNHFKKIFFLRCENDHMTRRKIFFLE